jgi:hypothetical protein
VNRNEVLPKADQCSLLYTKPGVLLRLTGAIVAVLLTFTAVHTIHRWHGERQLREKLFLKEGDAVFKAISPPSVHLLQITVVVLYFSSHLNASCSYQNIASTDVLYVPLP